MELEHTFMSRLLSAIFPFKVIINCNKDPYLIRWYVFKSKWFTVFIHKFVRSDEDRALHDHPWGWLVIPIWRGYIEHSDRPTTIDWFRANVQKRVYPIIGTKFRPATYRHRVELLRKKHQHWAPEYDAYEELPAWSIFIHFKREREWGFHTEKGWVHHQDWWTEKCE